jgi:hypothetical protein
VRQYLKQIKPKEDVTDVLKLIIGRSAHVWKDLKPSGVSKQSFLSQPLPHSEVFKGDGDGVLTDKVMIIHDDHPMIEGITNGENFDHCSNAVAYPPMSFMPWHTNSDSVGLRTYYSYSQKQSLFMWVHPETQKTHVETDNIGWTCRSFVVPSGGLKLWHSVWSEGVRFAFGFNRYRQH